MSAKLIAALSAAALLASANLASAQVRTHHGLAVTRSPAYADTYRNGDSFYNRDYWNAVAPWIGPSDPDPTKGTVFDSR